MWNVISALGQVNQAAGTAALAAALFPEGRYAGLTRELMACLLTFVENTGYGRDYGRAG